MAKTVRDILVNVGSGDLLLATGERDEHSFFDVVWGRILDNDDTNTLYANIVIPTRKLGQLKPDDDGRNLINAKSPYYPYNKPFVIRLVELVGNEQYTEIEQSSCDFPVVSLAYNSGGRRINACELPFINIDGYFLVNISFGEEGADNIAEIYTADKTDFAIGGSDTQASRLLAICDAGKYYRYPTTGIGITDYVNSVVAHSDLGDKISKQHQDNGIPVQEAEFDATTGELQVIFSNEKTADDEGLVPVSELDLSELDITDDMLRELAETIDILDYEDAYDREFVNLEIYSCYANEMWVGKYPWTDDDYWTKKL